MIKAKLKPQKQIKEVKVKLSTYLKEEIVHVNSKTTQTSF